MATEEPADGRPPLPGPASHLPGRARFGRDEEPSALEFGVGRGLRYLHVWTSRTREEAWQSRLAFQTLVDLLVAKGVMTADELDRQAAETAPAIIEAFGNDPVAPLLGPTTDKRSVPSEPIDCAARFPLCQARCCRLRFALSAEDLDEGIVRWDYGRPYLIAQTADGYCVHADSTTGVCSVYAHRPAPCRAYDCRGDTRIWEDFERRIPAKDFQRRSPARDDVGKPSSNA